MLRSAAGEANERPLQNPFGADEVCRMAWVVFWGGGGGGGGAYLSHLRGRPSQKSVTWRESR